MPMLMKNVPGAKKLILGEQLNVLITNVKSSKQFVVQNSKSKETARFLQKECQTLGNQNQTQEQLPFEKISVGMICLGKCQIDDLWYRAVVTKIIQPNLVIVYFFDFGDTQEYKFPSVKTHLVELKGQKLIACAPLGIKCRWPFEETKVHTILAGKLNHFLDEQTEIIIKVSEVCVHPDTNEASYVISLPDFETEPVADVENSSLPIPTVPENAATVTSTVDETSNVISIPIADVETESEAGIKENSSIPIPTVTVTEIAATSSVDETSNVTSIPDFKIESEAGGENSSIPISTVPENAATVTSRGDETSSVISIPDVVVTEPEVDVENSSIPIPTVPEIAATSSVDMNQKSEILDMVNGWLGDQEFLRRLLEIVATKVVELK